MLFPSPTYRIFTLSTLPRCSRTVIMSARICSSGGVRAASGEAVPCAACTPPAARPRLAGVVVVCEPVDDGGMGRVLSQIKNVLVREQAGHDDIVIPVQAARNVPAAA